jgi:coproporphyrinogen III oxidase-like Fe-S oxidoreductase
MKRSLLRELKTGLEMTDKDEPLVSVFIFSRRILLILQIFFGGGTPSLASVCQSLPGLCDCSNFQPDTIGAIIDWLKSNRLVSSNLEITLESNPTVCVDSLINSLVDLAYIFSRRNWRN